eukprot:m.424976 g.424976  ORF g.424976 m.424976 type:complete len:305 (-) comp21342_c2_seq11:323-1237(-)
MRHSAIENTHTRSRPHPSVFWVQCGGKGCHSARSAHRLLQRLAVLWPGQGDANTLCRAACRIDDGVTTGNVQFLGGGTSVTRWNQRLIWGSTGVSVSPGMHTITFAEREDGTMLKSVSMIAGYPQCHFGGPLPGANISILTVIENFEEANRVAEQRVNYQLSALQNLTTQLVANLSMNMQNESQRLTDIALDYSRQIDSVMGNISTAMNATATGLQTQISGLSSRVSGVLGAIAAVVAPGTSTGTTADTQGSVAKTGNDVVISAPGAVKVSGSTCSDVDVCALRASLQNIISAAAAAATGPSPP